MCRASAIHWNGGGGFIHHRTLCYEIWAWILHLLRGKHIVELPSHVRGRDCHESAWAGHVFHGGLDGTQVVQVEVR